MPDAGYPSHITDQELLLARKITGNPGMTMEEFFRLIERGRRASGIESNSSSSPSSDYRDYYSQRRMSRIWVPHTGNTLRAVVTLGLVLALMVVVFTAMIARLPASEMVQYAAPLTGLAGLAMGYWFGKEKTGA